MPFRKRNRRGGVGGGFLTDLSCSEPNPGRVFHVWFMPNGGMIRSRIYSRDRLKEIRWPAIRKLLWSRSIASDLALAAARRAVLSMQPAIRAALSKPN